MYIIDAGNQAREGTTEKRIKIPMRLTIFLLPFQISDSGEGNMV